MGALKAVLWPFQTFNDIVLPIGRWIAIIAIALMVVAILIQVFFRYVLNAALPWPDEAARFAMLWMTALIAPMAYRRGGFVAIDMLLEALPRRAAAFLSLILLLIAGAVLAMAMQLGWAEANSFMSRAATASLYWFNPAEMAWEKVPRRWMMSSLLVGMALLMVVNIELILRNLITLLGGGDDLKSLAPPPDELMAE